MLRYKTKRFLNHPLKQRYFYSSEHVQSSMKKVLGLFEALMLAWDIKSS